MLRFVGIDPVTRESAGSSPFVSYVVATVRQILHVDMDAFYASVEERDAPELRGTALLVGGSRRRGVVLAASYAARPKGVRSGMSMAEALRRCPEAVVVPPRMGRYAEVSAEVFAIFRSFTPLVEGLSLDEAFLDVTASRSLFGDGVSIARQIKERVRREVGLTASAGVAPCKFVAKIASDFDKPDGLVVVREDELGSFLDPLPIERMWGVGPRTAPKLRELGFSTLGDLARAELSRVERALGSWGPVARALARGDDPRDVNPARKARSIGAEETYETDLTTLDAIEPTLLEHAGRVAQRLVRQGLSARGVAVKLKYADFTIRSRRTLLPEPVADTDSIYRAAKVLLRQFPPVRGGVRLTGVTVTHLSYEAPPLALFPDVRVRRGRKVEELISRIEDRVGVRLTRAALASRPACRPDAARGTPGSRSRRRRTPRSRRR